MSTKLVKCICKNCDKEFLKELRWVTRGEGKFCSLRCAALYNNRSRVLLTLICKTCGEAYESFAKKSLYCSRKCNTRASKERRKRVCANNEKLNTRSQLANKIQKVCSLRICFICGYNKTICDMHHIVPKSKGGDDSFTNICIVCPNCHREIHTNIYNGYLPSLWDKLKMVEPCGVEPLPEVIKL